MSNSIFNLNKNAVSEAFSNNKAVDQNIYKIDLKLAKDQSKGYISKIRFLPNLLPDMSAGDITMKKEIHYVKIPNQDELNGALVCNKNFESKCPICDLYWKFHNSKDIEEQSKKSWINKSTTYYSYVLILEDEQRPDLVGKIMIFQYGTKIRKMIMEEDQGLTDDPCNVFDLAKGKDFTIVCNKQGEWNNYDSSKFSAQKPLWKYGKGGKKVVMPTEMDANGELQIAEKAQAKVCEMLLKRDANLEDYAPKPWDDADRKRVDAIVAYLSGEVPSTSGGTFTEVSEKKSGKVVDDTMFEDEDDDEFFGEEKNESSSQTSEDEDFFGDDDESTTDESSDSDDEDDFFED